MKNDTPLIERTFDVTGAAIYDKDSRFVAAVMAPTEQDIARRLVAAWNACRGIPTTDIERGRIEITRINNSVTVGINNGKISLGKN